MAAPVDASSCPAQPAAAAFIRETVGDLGRPSRAVRPSRDLDHLPGERGVIAGVRNAIALLREGATHSARQRARFGAVFRTQLGPTPMVCVADPELVLRVTRNEDRVWSTALGWRVWFDGVNPLSATTDSPGQLDFEPHRDARKLLQPAFGAAAMAGYVELAAPVFEQAAERWSRRGQVDFKRVVRRVLARASSRIFMGIDDAAEAAVLERAVAQIWAAPTALVRSRLDPTWAGALSGYRRLRETFTARVAERRARGGGDLFSRMCAESRVAPWLDDDALVRLYIGVVIATFDTTSSALTSMAYLLAKHPGWQERLRDEARAAGQGRVTYESAKQLDATLRVWSEAMRLYPVGGFLPRLALRDTELGGHRIPAGALVHAQVDAVMRDPAWWTDPERFDPDRFAEGRAEDRLHKGAFLPFGAGAHACIGAHLAGVEAAAFWHAILTRCRFRLEPAYDARHAYQPMGMVTGRVRLAVSPAATPR
jgi:cytochrome P450